MNRRFDAATVLEVILITPVVIGSIGVMALIGRVVWREQPWVVPTVWAAFGFLVLIPLVERGVGRVVLGMCKPADSEKQRLESPWHAVCRKANVSAEDYVLRIDESDELNAAATGGTLVAVTRKAMRLDRHVLEAILAHELGHHLAGHTQIRLLSLWFRLPTWLLFLLLRLIARAARAIAVQVFGLRRWVANFLATVAFLGLLALLVWIDPWLAAGPVLSPLVAWTSRMAEYRADRAAADLGYRDVLIAELKRWQVRDGGDRRSWFSRVFATHPAHIDRVRRLQEGVRI